MNTYVIVESLFCFGSFVVIVLSKLPNTIKSSRDMLIWIIKPYWAKKKSQKWKRSKRKKKSSKKW